MCWTDQRDRSTIGMGFDPVLFQTACMPLLLSPFPTRFPAFVISPTRSSLDMCLLISSRNDNLCARHSLYPAYRVDSC